MASPLDRYIAAKPELREVPRDELLTQLFNEVDRSETFEEFAEDVLRDPDSPLGERAKRMGGQSVSSAAAKALGAEPEPDEWKIGQRSIFKDVYESVKEDVALPGEVAKRAYEGNPMPQEEMEKRARGLALDTVGTGGINQALRWSGRGRMPRQPVQEPPRTPPGGPMDRVTAHPERTPGELTNAFDRAYSKVYDEFHAVNKGEKAVTGEFAGSPKTPLLADESPYKILRLSKGNPERMKLFIEQGTYDFATGEKTGPGLKQVMEPVKDILPDAMNYALSKRALEKGAQGVETGIDQAAAQRVVGDIERLAAEGDFKAASIVRFQKDLVGYNDRLLQLLVDSGVVSQEGAVAIRAANQDYLPFYRLLDPNYSSVPGRKSTTPIKGMTGSEAPILDPLESIIRNTYSFIQISERNRAAQALYKLIVDVGQSEAGGAGAQLGREVKPGIGHNSSKAMSENEVMEFLNQQGVKTNNPEPFTAFRPSGFSSDEIPVMFDGQRRWLKVDPEIAKAWSYLDREAANAIVQAVSYPARMLRAGITLDPGFSLKNFFRDQLHAMVTTPGYVPFYDAFVGLGHYMNGSDTYFKWAASGGAQATRVAIDEAYQNVAKYKLVGPSALKDAGTVVDQPFDMLRRISNAMENATRVGAYQRAIKQGYDPMDAAYIARESTVDFQRMGQYMREWNMITAFQNPNLQGVDRMARAVAARPVWSSTILAGGLTVPSVGLWYLNKDDPRYQQMPRWQKDITWPVWLPGDWTGSWKDISEAEAKKFAPQKYYDIRASDEQPSGLGENPKTKDAIPIRLLPSGRWQADYTKPLLGHKPFEVGVLFGSVLGERVPELFLKDNPDAFKTAGKSIERALLPPLMPTIGVPHQDIQSNWSSFFERPIVGRSQERLLPEDRYSEFTTETAKGIASGLRKVPGLERANPIATEYWIRGWTGTLGQLGMETMDKALNALGITDKTKPSPGAEDYWITRSFTSRYPSSNAQSIVDFYEKFSAQEEKVNSIRAAGQRAGQEQRAADLRTETKVANVKPHYDLLNTHLKSVQDIMRDNSKTPDEKRRLIDKEVLQAISVAIAGNKKMTEEAGPVPTPTRGAPKRAESDQRMARFGALSNEAQKLRMQGMDISDQMMFGPYLRQQNRLTFNNWYVNLTAEDQFAILQDLDTATVNAWLPFSRDEVREHYKAEGPKQNAKPRRRR